MVRALGVLVLLVVGLFAYLNVAGADVVITNTGRSAIQVKDHLPPGLEPLLSVLGVRGLPEALTPGAPATIRLPKIFGGEIDVTQPGTIGLTVLGRTVQFSGRCDTLTLNGTSLLGRRTTFSVGERSSHQLQLSCS